MVVTFRLDVDQFGRLLSVVMADDVEDHLSNAILVACTRPHAGIISVPLPMSDGTSLVSVLDRVASNDPSYDDLASVIRSQYATAASDWNTPSS